MSALAGKRFVVVDLSNTDGDNGVWTWQSDTLDNVVNVTTTALTSRVR